MEKLAQSLPKKEPGDDSKKFQMPKKPDSGKSSSGRGNLTTAQLDRLAATDQGAYREYVAERNKTK
jgi:hypothetical protein